jgi:hypothetical protein
MDRQALVEAFEKGQNNGLVTALSKIKAVGHCSSGVENSASASRFTTWPSCVPMALASVISVFTQAKKGSEPRATRSAAPITSLGVFGGRIFIGRIFPP